MKASPRRRGRVAGLVVLTAGLLGATLLAAPAAVSAPVPTTSISGVVKGIDGKPLQHVTVTAESIQDGFDLLTVGTAVTGRDGSYHMTAYQFAQVEIQFDATGATGGTSPTGYADQCYRNAAHGPYCLGGSSFDLRHVRTLTVDGLLRPAGVIRGRVVDSLGRGVGGLRVVDVPLTTLDDPRATDYVDTDVNGNYALRADAWTYEVDFGLGVFGSTLPAPATPARDGYSGNTLGATVTFGGTVVLNDTLTGGGAFAGTVVDQDGAPVAGATVTADLDLAVGSAPTTSTAPDGTFRLGYLPVGPVPWCVSAPHFTEVCSTEPPPSVREFRTTQLGQIVLHLES